MKLPFTLKQLRALKAVISKKNFTKAAEMLFISQPALSKQIRILEKQLGTKLVKRKDSKLTLTETGKVFVEYSERILSLCEESCRTVNDLEQGFRENLIIGINKNVSTFLILRLLIIFIKKYPYYNIQLHINSKKKIFNHIINKKLDVGLINGNIKYDGKKNFKILNILEDELVLFKNELYFPLKIKNSLFNVEELTKLNFVILNSNFSLYKHMMKNFLSYEVLNKNCFKFIIKLNSINSIRRSVQLGLGCTFVSLSLVNEKTSFKTIKINNFKVKTKLSALINVQNYDSNIIGFLKNSIIYYKN